MRLLVVLLLVVVAGCTASPAPPGEKAPEGGGGTRLALNDSWTYNLTFHSQPHGTAVARVVAADEEQATVETTRTTPSEVVVERNVLQQGSLALRSGDTSGYGGTLEPPFAAYAPLANHTYQGVVHTRGPGGLAGNLTLRANVTLVAVEPVHVPAGEFQAYHLRIALDIGSGPSTSEAWYVPSLGSHARMESSRGVEELVAWHRAGHDGGAQAP